MTDMEEYSQEFVELAMQAHAGGRFAGADAFRQFVEGLADEVHCASVCSGEDGKSVGHDIMIRMIGTVRTALGN